ncbi:BAH_G0049770.mRNA.1.CDS.1 [Saccharomyces cerevisiae]|nr:SX2_G0033860.mRNA.1.CDS.1 [Saccharomyces cerevisiae]CAI4757099.1 BAH_G0049770.mRNA.1.CDS.1 [Saccharomyces cerevisiae]CAI4758672.1 BAG_1a_G0049760.mRNA.1.CDS.1 [Saccharomyces cerevisiae]CAI7321445.1 BAG_1a_G0049760.mRNA.1.CDS.1 [Saccharomyces cerevisiae]CAI7323578.1 BAH_G0049770.mRNA.1.CDS.1 [Saccharomyces cerevisiae]
MANRLLIYGLILWVSIIGSFALDRNKTAQNAKIGLHDTTVITTGSTTNVQKEHSSPLSTGSLRTHDFRQASKVDIRQADIRENGERKEQDALTQPATPRNPGDSSNSFLSFDEWKKVKSKEHSSGPERHLSRVREPVDPSCYKEKECIGEELEIDLGFLTNKNEWSEGEENQKGFNEEKDIEKVYKKKFNYASLDCAATIVKSNQEAIGATSTLIESKDKYLLNPCSAPQQFIVIELCEDILVEEIEIANYEFFSSTFKRFRVSVSDRIPMVKNEWTILGEFEAGNSRELQKFQIHNPQIWASYLKIEILSHYEDEFYCPISLIKVYGKSMMDEFKIDQLKAQEDKEQSIGTNNINNLNEQNIQDRCNNIETRLETPNTSNLSDLAGALSCTSKLIPLKFDEFFKVLNASFCPSKQMISSSSSSAVPVIPEESIFKNIMKRLSQLETNSSLTVSYIEEQSKLLSKSFEQLEMAHEAKFSHLVTIFNETMMSNLDLLNNFANQLKDQSLRILEEQKLENDKFTNRHLLHLERLEKEVSFQRRIVYASFFAFVGLISYLLITRELYFEDFEESKNGAIEKADIVQQAIR